MPEDMGPQNDMYNACIEKMRCSEYPQLSKTTYLDHAGTTLYARSLIDAYHRDLTAHLYGNPHSYSPASDLSTKKVDEARLAVLNYFHASPDQFDVVFTANATAAIKLVADCFRDQDFEYVYHKDVHTSVVGVRELSASASQCLTTNEDVENWIELQKFRSSTKLQLFAFPAQSNLNGYRPPYSWCRRIHDACRLATSTQSTYVLLDAASYLTSGRLDLSCTDDAPDFIALSFYKIFGFPDLGALIVKKTACDVLTHRRYFGGGTVDTVTVIGGAFHGNKQDHLHDFLEDGTLPFHNILALTHAIAVHERIYGSAEDISQHTAYVIAWLHNELKALKHCNGASVVDLYQDPLAIYGEPSTQGPIIAFNILKSDGSFIGKSHVERLAIDCGFQLRTGGVCNPGGIASMLHLAHWELMRNFTEGVRCGGNIDVLGAKPTGICRVSLGPMSTMSDVTRFVNFIKDFFVERTNKDSMIRQRTISSAALDRVVTPIDGCSGYSPDIDDIEAHNIWEKQWCIVDSKTGNPLQLRTLENLTVSIDVKSEQLRIAHTPGNEVAISLWEIPKSPDNINQRSDEHLFDLYNDTKIDNWLSKHLGPECALARYRPKNLNQTREATTCVLNNCGVNFGGKQTMSEHYSVHAQNFKVKYPFNPSQIPAPAPTPTTREKWRQKLWKQSTKQSQQAKPTAKTTPSIASDSRHSVEDVNPSKSQPPTSISNFKVPSAAPDISRPDTGSGKLSLKEERDEKKMRTKDHRFSIIVTKVTGKV